VSKRTAQAGLVAFAWLLAAAVAHAAEPAVTIVIRTDRPDAVYRKGEQATFLIELARDGRPLAKAQLLCELSTDAFLHSEKRQLSVTDGKARLSVTRDVPCVLWLRATYSRPEGKPVQKVGGAAFSPTEIGPSMPPPEDFDEFWHRQKARLDAIPPNPVLESMPVEGDDVELYSITMDNIEGTKIYGYLAKPRGDGPYPGYLQVQWAGVYSLQPGWVLWPARNGFLALNINAHAIPNGKPAEFYRRLSEGRLKDYAHQGREDRQKCYFLRMFLSCYRAAEYLASRPDWDGKHLIVAGGSQGGGQAIVTAALSSQVSALAANVPALCDHSAFLLPDRAPGWPRLVGMKDGKPDPAQLQVARYFDAVNFASRVRVPALVGTGFGDLTCPASSVYAAFNVMKGPKRMVIDAQTGHVGRKPNWSMAFAGFLATHRAD